MKSERFEMIESFSIWEDSNWFIVPRNAPLRNGSYISVKESPLELENFTLLSITFSAGDPWLRAFTRSENSFPKESLFLFMV